MSPKHPVSRSRYYSVSISAVILAMLLASCVLSLPGSAPAASKTPNPANTLAEPVLPTRTPVPQMTAVASDTSVPTILSNSEAGTTQTPIPQPSATIVGTPTDTLVPVLSTPTAQPAIIPTSSAPLGSIAFAPGTTEGIVEGTVKAGEIVTYTLGAEQSQSIVLKVTSTNLDVTLGVIEPDGTVLVDRSHEWTSLSWPLPETGLYTIQVVGGAANENFTLTAKIPQRVNFATGTTSMVLNGATFNGNVFSYALNAQANQNMTVSLSAPAGAATLDIFGVATGAIMNASANATTWTAPLPQTQDYVIEVIPVNNQVVSYSLMVTITSPLSGAASNITFTPGTTAAVVQGTIQPGQVVNYTVSAEQYQAMVLNLESPNFDVFLGVYEPNGTTLASPGKKWTHWQWLLPQTELYTIQVNGGATTEAYTLTVKVAQRINFAPGTGSVTVNGTTTNGYVVSYVLKANGNQSMTVSINVSDTKAYLDVFGLATGTLLSPSTRATNWTGTLPQYQDYVIEVIPRNGQLTSYTLTVSVH